MKGPAYLRVAPCSQLSRPRAAPPMAVALRPVLTPAARGAFRNSGRDGETPFSRTEKLCAAREKLCSVFGQDNTSLPEAFVPAGTMDWVRPRVCSAVLG